MANTIKIKRGLSTNLSSLTLEPGELGVALDTQKLYVGDQSGVVKSIATEPGESGVYIGTSEPTSENATVWINTAGEAFTCPTNYVGTGDPSDDLGIDGDLYIKIS